MKIFTLENQKLTLNKEEILLVSEFGALWEINRNKGDGDSRGVERKLAFKEFTYMYLVYDWESPYKNFTDKERHQTAVEDSGLTDKQLKNEKFLAACIKYQAMQDTPQLRLLKGAYRMCDELQLFYAMADLQERDGDGKYVLASNTVITSIGNLGKMVAGLEELEEVVRKQKEAGKKNIRGDIDLGIFD
jgi:hypothetical protein